MPPMLTYSLLAFCAALFVGTLVLEHRRSERFARARKWSWVVQVAVVVAAYFVLRPGRMVEDPRQARGLRGLGPHLVLGG